MAQKYYNNFGLGWVPSADEINGNPQVLLRMDNLQLDEYGVVSNIKGPSFASEQSFGTVASVYSELFNLRNAIDTSYPSNTKLRYVFDLSARKVLRNWGPVNKSETNFEVEILSGTTLAKTDFVSALGHIFIYNGSLQVKDSGATVTPLYIAKPISPSVTLGTKPEIRVDRLVANSYASYWDINAVEGTNYDKTGNYLQVKSDSNTKRAIIQMGKDVGVNINTTNFDGVNGTDSPNDIFQFNFRVEDSRQLLKIRVEFLLNQPTASTTTPDITDYFWFEWAAQDRPTQVTQATNDSNSYQYTDGPEFRNYVETFYNDTVQYNSTFRIGSGVWTSLMCNRSLFNRVGNNETLGWHDVRGVRITMTSIEPITMLVNKMFFYGGKYVLNGTYNYIQVDVNKNNGRFIQKSLNSNPSAELEVSGRPITVQPAQVDINCDQCRIYRANKSIGLYYLVKIIDGAKGFTPASFSDTLNDIDAMRDNSSLDEFQLQYYRAQLPTDIIGAVWFKNRMIYVTTTKIIPSFENDPCTYDSRFVYEIADNIGETALFVAKVSEDQLIVATTKDFYSVTGDFTLETIENVQTLQVAIKPLNVSKASVGYAHYTDNSSLYFIAEDGYRVLTMTQNGEFSDALLLLFRGETRYDYGPIQTPTNANVFQYITKAKGRLVFCNHHVGTGRAFHIWNEKLKYWCVYRESFSNNNLNPIACFTEEDGTLIYGSQTGKLRIFEAGTEKIEIYLRTIRFDLDAPMQRKDIKSINVFANSGNELIRVAVNGVAQDLRTNGFIKTPFTSAQLSSLDLGTFYNLTITGKVLGFKFYGIGFDYDVRPIPTSRVKIPYTNYGDPRKKRVRAWPIKVDCRGASVNLTCYADGVQLPSQAVFNSWPGTEEYIMKSDVFAKDFQLELTSEGSFEYYNDYPYVPVEILPVEKSWDQFGPWEQYKIGSVYSFKIRLLPNAGCTIIDWVAYDKDDNKIQGEFKVRPLKHEWYEILIPQDKSLFEVFRLEFHTPNGTFHRTGGFIKVRTTGKETEFQYIEIKQ